MASADAPRPARRRGRPFLESPSLLLWIFIVDLLLVATVYLVLHASPGRTLLAHAGLLSFFTFVLFGFDKLRAGGEARRVSEINLLLLVALGGALGGLLGMVIFRHKTRRWRFAVLVPTFVFVHGVVATLVLI